jgi:AraC-like DNA-binding protein
MSADALSEVLRAVRLQGAVFYDVHVTAPWVSAAPPAKVVAPHVMPGAEHVIEYHVVTAGRCWGNIEGAEPVRLESGDVIVFPQGDAHVLSSDAGMRATPNLSLFARPVGGQLPVLIEEGGGGEGTHIVCGFLGYDARPFNPLLATLPRMIHVRGGGGLIDPFVRMAVDESAERRTGGEVVLARLSELMFVEVVRRYLATLPPEWPGWLGGLRDDFVGRALATLHDRPTHDWTIDELASSVGLSRSALAERFTQFVGTPPMQYLAQWRMQLASGLLAGGSASVAEVAHAVGYGSEAAFSRAFKRLVGVSPATWRAARQDTAVMPTAASP